MERLKDKIAFITGAASGIGRATAIRFAQEGAIVFITDMQQDGLEETAALVKKAGGQVTALVSDVSSEEQVKEAVASCIANYGRLDVLCNIAGILRFEHCHKTDKVWHQIIAVNLTGTFYMCREALPHLVKSKGAIVNTASTSALAGLAWGTAYSSSKGGVLALTRSIAVEYAKQGVRANAVCPGDIDTPMGRQPELPAGVDFTEMDRYRSITGPLGPEVVASVVAMLASEDAAHINGEDILVDGGTLA